MRPGGKLRFDGRVVVITGAGAGLGRTYALLFASRGASVVVNDLGGGRHGDGSNKKTADAVVDEIRRNGGKAVANYDSVLNGSNIVKTAIDTYGRIDVLINNAGILRDKSFAKLSETDWDLIQNVHVKGAFITTQAAWPYFAKQNYGRIIMTSSNSGLCGNFGQANYSTAKMGLVGLANTLAIEGIRKNIQTNVIVPTAGSRLTQDIIPPDVYNQLKPELIAPVVAWMCHEDCTENGSIIESALGWASKCHLVRSSGVVLRQNLTDDITPEAVQENWSKITDMSSAKYVESNEGALLRLLGKDDVSGASTSKYAFRNTYDNRDTILYALGVGASVKEPSDLRYLYENHEDFAVLPTYYVTYGPICVEHCLSSTLLEENIPGFQIDPTRLLHGEQYIEVHKPIPVESTVETRVTFQDALDKEKGTVLLLQHETFDTATGEKLFTGQISAFVVGATTGRGNRTSSNVIPIVEPPNRKPDASVTQKTSYDQAALYRLSGDRNPLHIDQNIAMLGGQKEPILHGLCSLGFSVRHVLQTYANGDPKLFKALKVRFAKPVIPGQSLRTDMWRNGNRIHFQTYVVENNTAVITGSYVDLTDVKTNELGKSPAIGNEQLESDAVFSAISDYIKANPDVGKKINGVFLYNITSNGKPMAQWTLDLITPAVYRGEPKSKKADTTMTLEDSDMIQMVLGKLNPQIAFLKGKVKITGNIMLSQKLKTLMEMSKAKI